MKKQSAAELADTLFGYDKQEPCFHCNDKLECSCPFCSPGYELVDGKMQPASGPCIAPHVRAIREIEGNSDVR